LIEGVVLDNWHLLADKLLVLIQHGIDYEHVHLIGIFHERMAFANLMIREKLYERAIHEGTNLIKSQENRNDDSLCTC
jgi:hypothetical protein